MPSSNVRALKHMLLGVEITIVGGMALLWGVLVDLGPLWMGGLLAVAFGFWVTLDAFANGPDPRRQSSEKGSPSSDND